MFELDCGVVDAVECEVSDGSFDTRGMGMLPENREDDERVALEEDDDGVAFSA